MKFSRPFQFVSTVVIAGMLVLSAGAIGFRPDPKEYQQALDAIVVHACKEFEKSGVRLDPHKLAYGEHEIVDSFLKGRIFYRDARGRHHPMPRRMERLAELLGESFPALEKKWKAKTARFKSGSLTPPTRDELRRRLDELRDSKIPPVKPDDGLCRSSSGCAAIEVKCRHCGRVTVYPDLDEIYHDEPPDFFERIAKELRAWGVSVEVDGRTVCPDCCPFPHDFKLAEGWPTVVKVRDDIDLKKEWYGRYLKPGLEMRVVARIARGTPEPGYDVNCPGFSGTLHVKEHVVTVARRERASRLQDIPATSMVINGYRCPVSDSSACALLAFVQGYDTFVVGPFADHYPVKTCEPWLRKILLQPEKRGAVGSNANENSSSLTGGTLR